MEEGGRSLELESGGDKLNYLTLTLPLKGTSPWMDVARTMQEQLSMELFKKL